MRGGNSVYSSWHKLCQQTPIISDKTTLIITWFRVFKQYIYVVQICKWAGGCERSFSRSEKFLSQITQRIESYHLWWDHPQPDIMSCSYSAWVKSLKRGFFCCFEYSLSHMLQRAADKNGKAFENVTGPELAIRTQVSLSLCHNSYFPEEGFSWTTLLFFGAKLWAPRGIGYNCQLSKEQVTHKSKRILLGPTKLQTLALLWAIWRSGIDWALRLSTCFPASFKLVSRQGALKRV